MEDINSNMKMDDKPFSYRMTLHQIWEELDKKFVSFEQVQKNEAVQFGEEYTQTK